MKKAAIFVILFFLIIEIRTSRGQGILPKEGGPLPDPKSVFAIGPNCVGVPAGRIILIRKGSDCCAVRFPKFWTGKTREEWYATYESYYQGDGSGDFSSKNVEFRRGEVSDLGFGSFLGSHYYRGDRNFQCGKIRLQWSGQERSWVCFYAFGQTERDHGYALAPTNWTDISEVDVSDPKLVWYKYDAKRKDYYLPIDEVWASPKEQQDGDKSK